VPWPARDSETVILYPAVFSARIMPFWNPPALQQPALKGTQPMPSPAFTFAFMVATICGATFHLIVGGDIRWLALYLLAGWAGFALGHLVGVLLNISFLQVGVVRLFTAVSGALLMLILTRLVIVRPSRR